MCTTKSLINPFDDELSLSQPPCQLVIVLLPQFLLSRRREFTPEVNLVLQLVDLRLSAGDCCDVTGLGPGQLLPDVPELL